MDFYGYSTIKLLCVPDPGIRKYPVPRSSFTQPCDKRSKLENATLKMWVAHWHSKVPSNLSVNTKQNKWYRNSHSGGVAYPVNRESDTMKAPPLRSENAK